MNKLPACVKLNGIFLFFNFFIYNC
jgi:hypothetical protein